MRTLLRLPIDLAALGALAAVCGLVWLAGCNPVPGWEAECRHQRLPGEASK